MEEICDEGMCAGCMACAVACPKNAVRINADIDACHVEINQDSCIDCGRCKRVCQQLNPAKGTAPIKWLQGWASSPEERASSSSGGVASSIARSFIERGGDVVACAFKEGRFDFSKATNVEGVDDYKGSKYVKSNPLNAYDLVGESFRSGKKVLFIGLPCQVSAILNYFGDRHSSDLYTIDLICHGTPSLKLLDDFLTQRGISLSEIKDIAFRRKGSFALRDGAQSVDDPGVVDRYMIAFLHGLSYTECCYNCNYARTERVSDLTLGDSWGTHLIEEEAQGVSLMLSMNGKGDELIESSRIVAKDVDVENAIRNNEQLVKPSSKPRARKKFVVNYKSRISVEDNVFRCLPFACVRQEIKRLLIAFGLKRVGGGYGIRIHF